MLSLESPACKVGVWLATGKLDFRSGLTIPWLTRVNGGPKLFVQTTLLVWKSGILVCARQSTYGTSPG